MRRIKEVRSRSSEGPDWADLGSYSEGDAKPMKGLSREVTQLDIHSNSILLAATLTIDYGQGGGKVGRGCQLGSSWDSPSRSYGSWTRLCSNGVQ